MLRECSRFFWKPLGLTAMTIFLFSPPAHASTGGGVLPFVGSLRTIMDDVKGPVATILIFIGIAIALVAWGTSDRHDKIVTAGKGARRARDHRHARRHPRHPRHQRRASVADDGANGPDLDPADNRASDTTPLTAIVDLEVVKDDGGVGALPGEPLVYQLTARNRGNRTATGVVLSEVIPHGTRLDASTSAAGWVCAAGGSGGSSDLCTLELGALGAVAAVRELGVRVDEPLPPTQSCLYNTVTVGADGAGGPDADLSNNRDTLLTPVGNATCTAGPGPDLTLAITDHGLTAVTLTVFLADDGTNGPDLNPADNQASEQTPVIFTGQGPGPDLSLLKDDGGITAGPGQVVVYVLGWTNEGTADASGVLLRETVPLRTTFDAAASTPGWVCSAGGGAQDTCTLAVGAVAVGAEGSAEFAVLIDAELRPEVGRITNVARIEDDGSHGEDLDPADNQAFAETPLAGRRVPDIPILGALGLILLGSGLGMLGMRRLRLAR